jgi:DNA-directed RNA polymerase specialized sigma24 family protein
MVTKQFQTGGAKKTWVFDPSSIEQIPAIRNALVHYDVYFDDDKSDDKSDSTLAIVMDKIMEDLPTDLADCVRLVHLKGLSYRASGKVLNIDHKTVKARVVKGVALMKQRLTDSVWISEMLRGYLPVDEILNIKVQGEKVSRIIDTLQEDND